MRVWRVQGPVARGFAAFAAVTGASACDPTMSASRIADLSGPPDEACVVQVLTSTEGVLDVVVRSNPGPAEPASQGVERDADEPALSATYTLVWKRPSDLVDYSVTVKRDPSGAQFWQSIFEIGDIPDSDEVQRTLQAMSEIEQRMARACGVAIREPVRVDCRPQTCGPR
jgi:hypothetical protein